MRRYRRTNIYMVLMLVIFAIGVIIGGIYSGGLGETAEKELLGYLTDFFESGVRDKKEIFLSSLFDNIRIFAVLFLAGFFRAGIAASLGIGLVEGFISGFTGATLIKLLGLKGFLISLSSVFSVVIFVVTLIIYGAYSINFGVSLKKRELGAKKEYLIYSMIALTIFCVASFFDGYITTIFMDLVVTKM